MEVLTRTSLVPAIVALAEEKHPYTIPTVYALPIVGGNPRFLQWIRDETAAASGPESTR